MEELNRNSSKKLLHKKEIGVMFGYGRDKTRRRRESGILPVIQINNDYVISAEELDKWMKRNAGKKIKL